MGLAACITVVACYFVVSALTGVVTVSVDTQYGTVTGKRNTYDYDIDGAITNTVDSFLGVPYAEQPLGTLRFKDPLPRKNTSRTNTNAQHFGPMCSQPRAQVYAVVRIPADSQMTNGEDCLRLNIYTPYEANHTGPYPVMVWIHGGSLQVGSANWVDGHVLAQYGVVVVTINYRLGVFGFLSDGNKDSILPGDYGINDQVMALKWVKDNIRAFRGNPDEVTIFGSSAGAWSVSLHLLLEASKGLFHRAIVQSGPLTAKLSHFHSGERLNETLQKLTNHFKCKTDTLNSVLDCLQTKGEREILRTSARKEWEVLYKGSRTLPEDPVVMYKTYPLNKVPVMMGVVAQETARYFCVYTLWGKIPIGPDGSYAPGRPVTEELLLSSLNVIINFSNLNLSAETKKEVLKEYIPTEVMKNRKAITRALININSDIIQVAPAIQMANNLESRGFLTYFYMFDNTFPMDINQPDLQRECRWLSEYTYHEAELPYLFGNPLSGTVSKSVWRTNKYSKADKDLSMRVMKIWTNFAKTSDPNSNAGVAWAPYKSQTGDYIDIRSRESSMKHNLRKSKIDFWLKIFDSDGLDNV